jgi:undecaprenyl-diphosphatase
MTPPVQPFAWDKGVFDALNRDFGPVVDALAHFFSGPRSAFLCAGGLIAWAVWRWRARATPLLLASLLAVLGTDVVGARVLKPFFARTRPCYSLVPGSFRQLVPVANSGALPSLHAANWFAAVTPLAVAAPAAAPALFGMAAVVGLCRVVAGVHWPSDVLFGSLLGITMGLLAALLVRAVARRWRTRSRRLEPRPGSL